jgi:hypothetical protein
MKTRWLTLLCMLLTTAGAAPGLAATADAQFSGTWTGSFDIHFSDGRVVNDTAWLVLQQSGSNVTGTVGPKADQQGPLREGTASGNELKFIADSTRGKTLSFTLKRDGDQLAGEAIGDIGDDRVRVVINATRQASTVALAPDALHRKMLELDTAMFDSFNKCSDPAELEKHATFFADDVEFYHDFGGLTRGADAVMANTKKNVCGKFRRELDPQTFRVFPIPGFGAMALGTHRFCHTPTTCEGIAEFTTVWQERDGAWKITRALSYAHRSLN